MEFLFRHRGEGKRQVKPSQDIALLEDQLAGESSDDSEYKVGSGGGDSHSDGSDDDSSSTSSSSDDEDNESNASIEDPVVHGKEVASIFMRHFNLHNASMLPMFMCFRSVKMLRRRNCLH